MVTDGRRTATDDRASAARGREHAPARRVLEEGGYPPPRARRGSSRSIRAALQKIVDTTARELLLPGAMVLLRTPQGEFAVAYGTTQLGTASPPRADTHFRIASNTKTMTAAVILQLAQEGKLGLDDPVSKYVAGVPNGDNITDRRSCWKCGAASTTTPTAPNSRQSMDRDPTRVWMPGGAAGHRVRAPAQLPAGHRVRVQQHQLCAARPHRRKARRQAAGPGDAGPPVRAAGPEAHAIPGSTVTTLPEPYSHGYLYGSSSVALIGHSRPTRPRSRRQARAGTLLPNDFTDLNHSFAAAAGGVISTAGDLATWIQALVSGRVLNAEYQRRWLDSPQPEDPNKPDGQKLRVRHHQDAPGDRTRSIFTAARPPATTRSWATTPPTT